MANCRRPPVKYFIISGSPVYGFRYVGPFDSHKEAEDYQQNSEYLQFKNGPNWWIAELLSPTKNPIK